MKALVVTAVIAACLVGLTWYNAHPVVRDAPDLATCDKLYAYAHTHLDTIQIDGMYPYQLDSNQPSRMTCGGLRAAYPNHVSVYQDSVTRRAGGH